MTLRAELVNLSNMTCNSFARRLVSGVNDSLTVQHPSVNQEQGRTRPQTRGCRRWWILAR